MSEDFRKFQKVVEHLKHDNIEMQKRAVDELGKMGTHDAIKALKQTMKTPSFNIGVRVKATETLGNLGLQKIEDDMIVSILVEAIKDETLPIREKASSRIKEIDEKVEDKSDFIPRLLQKFEEKNYRIREEIVTTIGEIGDVVAVEALFNLLLVDPSNSVRRRISLVLGKIGSETEKKDGIIQFLSDVMYNEIKKGNYGPITALGMIGRSTREKEKIIFPLVKAIEFNENSAYEAVKALKGIENKQVFSALISYYDKYKDTKTGRQIAFSLRDASLDLDEDQLEKIRNHIKNTNNSDCVFALGEIMASVGRNEVAVVAFGKTSYHNNPLLFKLSSALVFIARAEAEAKKEFANDDQLKKSIKKSINYLERAENIFLEIRKAIEKTEEEFLLPLEIIRFRWSLCKYRKILFKNLLKLLTKNIDFTSVRKDFKELAKLYDKLAGDEDIESYSTEWHLIKTHNCLCQSIVCFLEKIDPATLHTKDEYESAIEKAILCANKANRKFLEDPFKIILTYLKKFNPKEDTLKSIVQAYYKAPIPAIKCPLLQDPITISNFRLNFNDIKKNKKGIYQLKKGKNYSFNLCLNVIDFPFDFPKMQIALQETDKHGKEITRIDEDTDDFTPRYIIKPKDKPIYPSGEKHTICDLKGRIEFDYLFEDKPLSYYTLNVKFRDKKQGCPFPVIFEKKKSVLKFAVFDKGIKILFLAANPKDKEIRDFIGEEIEAIENELVKAKFRDIFDIDLRIETFVGDLSWYILKYEPDIVHFSAHKTKTNELVLSDKERKSKVIPKEVLAELFSVFEDRVRCIVLNDCFSQKQAKELAKYVESVVGIPKHKNPLVPISFAEGLYRGLAFGLNLEKAVNLGKSQVKLITELKKEPKIVSNIDPKKIKFD